jgi:PAS domain S-box-containing protein
VDPSFQTSGEGANSLQVLWEDDEWALCRRVSHSGDDRTTVLVVVPVAEHPSSTTLDRLAYELSLKDELDPAWAVRPTDLKRDSGRRLLVLEDPGGEPLARRLGQPLEVGHFLAIAIGAAAALGKVHQHGLIHKDIKPANIVVGCADGHVRLTGFGIASRLPRERQVPEAPETIAGTLPYMAPEQTGRMNRSVDARSDLYALGVTLYQMLTGVLPFTAADPLEWVHCHIARQPVPPSERSEHVPAPVSAIIMKLLAKMPEERYQTAGGVERDLRRCLSEWELHGRMDEFSLGQQDTSDRLLIPERLYGRQGEIDTLIAAFDRVVAEGTSELVLVSGYAGIGKSSVVNELHKELVPPRGLFAAGKFDQYKRDIPYATVAQAFQRLVRQILGRNEVELARWRDALREALGPNGQLMTNLIPELALIIGEQPPVPDLPQQDAQRRFHLVFRRFTNVFARPEHPLVLFLDDLQWLDAATLDLMENLLTQTEVRHLLLIGAYRDNEVGPAHPLTRKLYDMRQAGVVLNDIVLAPLTRGDLKELIADSLRCDPEHARPLATLVHGKTAGNPFFAIQFLSALCEEGLLTFDHAEGGWTWELQRIHAKGYTANVVDLMVWKLRRLAPETQNALKHLACLGNSADFTMLQVVYQDAAEQIHRQLMEALRAGFVLRTKASYYFLHDRIHEAAYSLIPPESRAEAHLRIGTLIAAHTPVDKLEEGVFEIVNQLNRGSHLATSDAERARIAELNYIAGRRAKVSTAYASALKYLHAALTLLTEENWKQNYGLIFSIQALLAECEVLTTDMAAAESRLSMLAERARGVHDIALVTRLRLTLYTTLDRSDRAIEVFIEYLRGRGTVWSPHPNEEEVSREYDRIWSLLRERQIEELVDLPMMTDPDVLDDMNVFAEVVTPALFLDARFLALVICRMVSLSLEHGNTDGSCYAYVWLGMLAGSHFGNYPAGFRFGQLGCDLVEKRGLHRYEARTHMSFATLIIPWAKHVETARELHRSCFDAAYEIGDLTYAAYGCNVLYTTSLAAGAPLAEVHREAETGLAFATSIRFVLVIDCISAQLGLIRTLRGLTATFGVFNDERFDELRFERHLASSPVLALPECWYWIRKLQARFVAGDYPAAIEASLNAERLLWTSPGFFETAEYHFYGALSRAAAYDSAADDLRHQHFEALAAHQRQHEIWAENCPENFENRAALISAEIARIEGRVLEAERLYEQAIRSAHRNGFINNEGIAYEVAARFYAARGFQTFADAYLLEARHCYERWGADGKVAQLDQLYPHLKKKWLISTPTNTILAPAEFLDLTTVIKVSQAISGEMVLDRLIDSLIRTAVEQAGAERGLFILSQGGEQHVAAEATTEGNVVVVHLCSEPMATAMLPVLVLNYVLRTRESVVLDDATARSQFADDDYIRQRQVRSVLCLPLLNQAKVIGVLYLENNLAPRVFSPARIAVLKLLASQAATSLENSRLYRDLAEREGRIRRLVDSDVIGIVIWDLDGRLIDANDAFLRMVQYDREDLRAGMRWFDMTPPEWQQAHVREEAEELEATGMMQAREKEFFRRDGSRVPVLIGAAAFDSPPNQGVAYILDLTERKRAEAEARESERRYREVQMELAHANRVTTMGQLTGSIAHEVNQPITATIINAQTALRWLARRSPDLDKVRQLLTQIIKNDTRASEVIHRIRDLIKKAPPQQDLLEINGQISDVIELTRIEAMKNCVSVTTELADGLPSVRGDRVQLQQLMLNLILNAIEAMSEVDDGARDLQISTGIGESGGVLVTVRDSGPGLDVPSPERVFEAFYTTKAAGLGMGLSICRSIVEAHGGRLWASANEPRGAVFQFTLPAWEETASTDHALQMQQG